jgi:translocation and assembly module TamB
MRRTLLVALAGLTLLALALVWAAQSEAALAWFSARVATLSRGRVAIEGASGSLLGTLRAERVLVKTGETLTTAQRVEVTPRWRTLAQHGFVIDALSVGHLHVEPGPGSDEPPEIPAKIGLPFAIEIERIAITRLTIGSGGEFSGVRGALTLGTEAHEATLDAMAAPWGVFSGNARVGAERPFALNGEVRFSRDELPRTRAHVVASGSLMAAKLALRGKLAEAVVTGEAGFSSFARPWLGAISLRTEHLDTANFVAGETAPHSDIAAAVEARGANDVLVRGTLRAENATPGPVNSGRVPLSGVTAALAVDGGTLSFSEIAGDLGAAGDARGAGALERGTLRLDLALARLDLRALHEGLVATQLAGRADVTIDASRVEAALALKEAGREIAGLIAREGDAVRAEDVRIAALGGVITGRGAWDGASAFSAQAKFSAFDPAALGDFPSAQLSGELDASGEFGARWSARLDYALAGSRYRGRALEGRGVLTLEAERVHDADAELRIGANRLRAKGAFGAPGDVLDVAIAAPNLAELGGEFRGKLTLDAQLRGSLEVPGGTLRAEARDLALPGVAAIGALALDANIAASGARQARVDLRASELALGGVALESASLVANGPLAAHELELTARGSGASLTASLAGSWDGAWSGHVRALELAGRLPAHLLEPAPLRWAPPGEVSFGPARIAALGGELAVGTFEVSQRRLETAGVASDLSLADALAAFGGDAAAAGDLRMRGVWVVPRDPAQLGQVRLELASGDAQLGGAPLGVRAFQLDAALGASVAHVNASVSGERLGEATLRGELRAAAGRALLARTSSLDAQLAAEIASIRALGGLLGISARVDGRASLALRAGGTVRKPRLGGEVRGEALRFDWPAAGIALRDGQLAARLTSDTLHVDALSFAASQGAIHASGSAPLDGSPAALRWKADGLRVLDRPDRNLEVSGEGSARIGLRGVELDGEIRAERGYLELPRTQQARLGGDVIVLGRERAPSAAGRTRLALDLMLDAGKDLRVVGSGLDTFLRGKLRVRTLADGTLVAFGEIDASRGTYHAFGQKLEIERGALIFNGAIDDPALDALALRKNLPVEAGVELTGTLKTPLARLTSKPPVPDSEKLSWIVLGHGVSDASSADTALLQAAAATIFEGDGAVPISQRIARGVGLDEISLRNTGERAQSEATSRAVALGKRLTEKLYLEYEYGLEAASHLVRLHYALSRTFSVRAETTGETSNLGVNYRKSWD